MSDDDGKKTNGSGGNGHDKDDDPNIVKFPTLAERDRQRRADKQAAEQAGKAQQAANSEPFINLDRIPPFIRLLIPSMVIIHLALNFGLSKPALYDIYNIFGFVPAYFTGNADMVSLFSLASPITHMFIHSSTMHLLFNVVMGTALGIYTERFFGARATAIFFFTCGACGALAFLILNPTATFPLIGASGGISGFFGAVISLMHAQGQMGRLSQKPLWIIVAFWTAFMFITALMGGGTGSGNVAWQAHIGGFLGGVGIIHLIKIGKLKL